MPLIIRWIVNALALLALAYLLPGIVVSGFYAALIAALVLGIINAILRPILIVLTLPITLITLGLFTFVINGFLFWFAGTIVKGFEVQGFWTALLGALIMACVNALIPSKKKHVVNRV